MRLNGWSGQDLSVLKFSDESDKPLLGCCHLIGNFKEILQFLAIILNIIIDKDKL